MFSTPLWVWMLELAATMTDVGLGWFAQSLAVILLGLASGRLFRSRGSAIECGVYRTTLIVIFACPLVGWLLSTAGVSFAMVSFPGARAMVVAKTESTPSTAVAPSTPVDSNGATQAGEIDRRVAGDSPVGLPWAEDSADTKASRNELANSRSRSIPEAVASAAPVLSAIGNAHDARMDEWTVRPVPATLVSMFSVFGMLGASVLLARLFREYLYTVSLRRSGAPSAAAQAQLCRDLAKRIGVGPPRL